MRKFLCVLIATGIYFNQVSFDKTHRHGHDLKKEVYYTYRSLETSSMPHKEANMEKHQVQSGGRRSQGKCEQAPLLWFPREQTREAEEAGLASSSLNNFSGFCSVGVVVLSCLVLTLGN